MNLYGKYFSYLLLLLSFSHFHPFPSTRVLHAFQLGVKTARLLKKIRVEYKFLNKFLFLSANFFKQPFYSVSGFRVQPKFVQSKLITRGAEWSE